MAKPGRARAGGAQRTSACGSVNANAGPISIGEIKSLVLAIVPAPQSTPDKTPVAQLRPGPDASYILATDCMNHSRFQADGLWAMANYFTQNGTTFGDFYKCIACCYKNHRT